MDSLCKEDLALKYFYLIQPEFFEKVYRITGDFSEVK